MAICIKSKKTDGEIRNKVNAAVGTYNHGRIDEALTLVRDIIDTHIGDFFEPSDIDVLDVLISTTESCGDRDYADLASKRRSQIETLPRIGSLATFSDDYRAVDRDILHGKKAFIVKGQYPVIENVVYVQGAQHKCIDMRLFDTLDSVLQDHIGKYPSDTKKTFYLGSISPNFWHFLFNIVTRLSYQSLADLDEYEQFVCFGDLSQKKRDILINMGVASEKILILPVDQSIHFENLTIYPCGVHSYRHDWSSTRMAMYHDAQAITAMRSRIMNTLGIVAPPPSVPVFVWRDPVGKRDLHNQMEIVNRFGFKVFDPIKHTLREEVEILSSANLIVGGYGAGLSSILFASEGTHVIQLGISDNEASFYELIAHDLGLNFHKLDGRATHQFSQDSWKEVDRADYEIRIEELDALIKTMRI